MRRIIRDQAMERKLFKHKITGVILEKKKIGKKVGVFYLLDKNLNKIRSDFPRYDIHGNIAYEKAICRLKNVEPYKETKTMMMQGSLF